MRGLKLRAPGNLRKKDVHIYSRQYYFARKLYFDYKLAPDGEIIHAFKSQEIAKMLSKEFNLRVPDSTIRRWAVTPDKEFEGRTWTQEWQQRIDKGVLQAMSKRGSNEHLPESPSSLENKGLTPMTSLSEMSRKSLLNDVQIVSVFENVFKNVLLDIERDSAAGKLDYQKLKVIIPLYMSAKERFSDSMDRLKELEGRTNSEPFYGGHVVLQDPQARERVRRIILRTMDIFHQQTLGAPGNVYTEQEKDVDLKDNKL